ncbi:MAG: SMC-Scp complex subunit ScpB [bacterium]|nr:SMC-Scp complex subunit ScpB [bacterium]
MLTPERAQLEAILFATDLPLTITKIAELLVMPVGRVEREIEMLEEYYQTNGHALTVSREGNAVRLRTRKEFAEIVIAVRGEPPRLTKAALETLAIIALSEQAVTRTTIERIRGVDSETVINGLVARGLIEEAKREDTIGRPIVYRVTELFCELFGLSDISELKTEFQKLQKTEQPNTLERT